MVLEKGSELAKPYKARNPDETCEALDSAGFIRAISLSLPVP